ncbi:MAG: hypothetical protein IMZ53_14075, partial [Thermoplasmata archaeon]|nr:hypothetical protein [Thermoplasmata archaeon]MBE3141698.1 hypothetical protein [Thermoplasmata archaeon]
RSPPDYNIYRGFVFFNTSTLPANAYLDSATLSLYKKDDYSTTDFAITIQNGQPTYPHNPMQSSDYNKNDYSGNGGALNTSLFTSGYNAIIMNNLSWINKTGTTKLCLRSSRDISGTTPTGSEYINVHSRIPRYVSTETRHCLSEPVEDQEHRINEHPRVSVNTGTIL